MEKVAYVLVAGVIAATASLRLARAEEFNPYEIPREQFTQRVQVIALKPLLVPFGTANPDRIRQFFEVALTERIADKGYQVIPSAEFGQTWREMSRRLGGVYDPVSGIPNEKRADAVREYTARELKRRFAADAILEPYIGLDDWIPAVRWSSIYAGDDVVTWRNKPIDANWLHLPQKVIGSYLNVVITDLDGVKLYGVRMNIEWIKVYFVRSYEEKASDLLYRDGVKNQHAVDVVTSYLEPLKTTR